MAATEGIRAYQGHLTFLLTPANPLLVRLHPPVRPSRSSDAPHLARASGLGAEGAAERLSGSWTAEAVKLLPIPVRPSRKPSEAPRILRRPLRPLTCSSERAAPGDWS